MSSMPRDTARVVDGVVDAVARWPAVITGEGVVEFEPGVVFAGMLWDGTSLSSPQADEPGPPAPARRLVPKSVVQERVNALGKLTAAFQVLNADAASFGRWFAPDWPRVYADDPGLLAVLAQIGCTPGEIEAITAPV